MTDVMLTAMQDALLAWFAHHARALPWRQTRDPYHILVSEMMLQQTQVHRVLPRYADFLATFPTIHDLAAAPSAEVIRQWSGLGYNRRAVNLHKIARLVVEEYGGTFPCNREKLQQLPGVGHYTAGAIACFAFEQDVPFLDTNMRRVILRCVVGEDTTKKKMLDRVLLQKAEMILPSGRGWEWNQALIELGALICIAVNPSCQRCPLRPYCQNYATMKAQDEHIFDEHLFQNEHPFMPAPLLLSDGDLDDSSVPSLEALVYPHRGHSVHQVSERPSEPFIGSNRYYRGRVVALLRSLPSDETLSLQQIGLHLKEGYQEPEDAVWVRGVVDGLVRDGLAELVDNHVRLPTG